MPKKIKILYPRLLEDLDNTNHSCPTLEKILRKSRMFNKKYYGHEDEIRLLLTGYQDPREAPPLASLMANFDLEHQITTPIISADPVHLRADKNRVYLFDSSSFAIKIEEAEEMISSLNNFFEKDSIEFFLGKSPYRWYLKGLDTFPFNLPSPSMMAGLPLEYSANEMLTCNKLKTIFSEIQMILFSLPLNSVREKQGHVSINSVWFWGGGQWNFNLKKNTTVITDCEILQACCQASSVHLVKFQLNDSEDKHLENLAQNLYIGFSNLGDSRSAAQRLKFVESLLEENRGNRLLNVELITNHKVFKFNYFSKLKFWKTNRAIKDFA